MEARFGSTFPLKSEFLIYATTSATVRHHAGLMKLAYRGQSFEDESRKLEHYGVRYWNKKFQIGRWLS